MVPFEERYDLKNGYSPSWSVFPMSEKEMPRPLSKNEEQILLNVWPEILKARVEVDKIIDNREISKLSSRDYDCLDEVVWGVYSKVCIK